jgi:hypothetical protein
MDLYVSKEVDGSWAIGCVPLIGFVENTLC